MHHLLDPRALCAVLLLALVACGQKGDDSLPGYVESEPTRLASPVAGRLIALNVARGNQVAADTPLFVLDQDAERAAVDQAEAQLKRQRATVADLSKGKRSDELRVLEAQARQAAAQLALAQSNLKRQQELAAQHFVSPAGLDSLRAQVDTTRAQLAEAQAQLKVAQLAARQDTRAAAEADVDAARAALAQNEWKLGQKTVAAPVAGRIEDTLYRVGEWVPAGSPVVEMLAPGAIKLRFYVPQAALGRVAVGARVQARCDGCGAPIDARVSFVASQAEFTPPVIYSKENRQRLVFLVEARPDAQDLPRLHPGQPVDVTLSGRAAQ